ncbi:unnamed protein product [Ambrosiozyma monospora]|uniref:Unnamed protein product n=1 Tax=Ambrosiozyma monospora TaxID=43982 RepID=A0A9W6Z592_AMBMO|nr:unnamed protein product [Ambrosiozyma monospora]
MKFTLSAVSLALITRALADETVQLYIKSDNSDLSDKGISSLHEGAGINYFFAASSGQDLTYTGTSLTSNQIGYPQFFTPDTFVQLSVADEVTGLTFADDGTLQYNGSEDGFQACKNVNDPYRYSQSSYAIMYKSSSGDCVDIKLYKKSGSGSGSGSASGSASGAASSSAAPVSSSSAAAAVTSSESAVITTTTGNCTDSVTNTQTHVSTETDTVSCHKCSISTYSGAAADLIKPAGFAAMAAGVAALLI